jgi:hypothetical protein
MVPVSVNPIATLRLALWVHFHNAIPQDQFNTPDIATPQLLQTLLHPRGVNMVVIIQLANATPNPSPIPTASTPPVQAPSKQYGVGRHIIIMSLIQPLLHHQILSATLNPLSPSLHVLLPAVTPLPAGVMATIFIRAHPFPVAIPMPSSAGPTTAAILTVKCPRLAVAATAIRSPPLPPLLLARIVAPPH